MKAAGALGVVLVCAASGCFQPVDELSRWSDSGDSSVEPDLSAPTVVAKVHLVDLAPRLQLFATLDAPTAKEIYDDGGSWPLLHELDDGELLFDSTPGVLLADGGFSAPPSAWPSDSLDANSPQGWVFMHGDWYWHVAPATFDNTPRGDAPRLELWKLDHALHEITPSLTFNTALTDTAERASRFEVFSVFDGQEVWITNYDENSTLGGATKTVVAPISWDHANSISDRASLVASAYTIIYGGHAIANTNDGPRVFHFTPMLDFEWSEPIIGAGHCEGPLVPHNDAYDAFPVVLCAQDAGSVFDVVRGSEADWFLSVQQLERLNGGHLLLSIDPIRYLATSTTSAGEVLLDSCSQSGCRTIHQLHGYPPNVGMTDAGELLIADFVVDAGMRIARFPAGTWE